MAGATAETCALIEGEGGMASPVAGDVSVSSDVQATVSAYLDRYGRIDMLHNNVGVGARINWIAWARWPSYVAWALFKHNTARRHRIPKARYRVTKWPAYEAGLRRHGDMIIYRAATAARQHDPPLDIIIPPRTSAVPSTGEVGMRTQRDRHIALMADKGRMGWQRATAYGRRNHAEATMGRTKHLIGPRLRARTLPTQRGEVAIAVSVLDRMIRVVNPVSVRRA